MSKFEDTNLNLNQAVQFCAKVRQTLGNGDVEDEKSSAYLFDQYVKRVELLQKKLSEKNLNIMVCGEVSTGKSSFINTLMKDSVCATDVSACTNVISIIKYDTYPHARIHFYPTESESFAPVELSDLSQIASYTSEKDNKDNKKSVHLVEVFMPNDILKQGSTFIDTPGLGAINIKHAATTFSASKVADVLFFLSSPQREISQSEVDNLKKIVSFSKCKNIVYIMAKSDLSVDDQIFIKDQETLAAAMPSVKIDYLRVSTAMYNEGLANKCDDDIVESGMPQVHSLLSAIMDDVENILADKCLQSLYWVLLPLVKKLNTMCEVMQNPTTAEKKKQSYTIILQKLHNLQQENHAWRLALQNGFANLQIDGESKLNDSRNNLQMFITNKLKEDKYLDDPELLVDELQMAYLNFAEETDEFLHKGVEKISDDVATQSQLKEISKEIASINTDNIPEVLISDPANFGKFAYNTRMLILYIGFSGLTATIGGIVGAVVSGGAAATAGAEAGATAGSLGGPIGVVAGAAIGLVIGVASYKFTEKATKRSRLTQEFLKNVNFVMNRFSSDIKKNLTNASHAMQLSFESNIKSIRNECQQMKNELDRLVIVDDLRRQQISTLYTEGSTLLNSLHQ